MPTASSANTIPTSRSLMCVTFFANAGSSSTASEIATVMKAALSRVKLVKIRSPSTAIVDRNAKLAACEQFGVPSYWIFDPSPAHPELTVFELRDDAYQQVAQSSGSAALRVERPFPVEIVPARLTLS